MEGKVKLHGTGRAARIDLQDPLTVAYLKAESKSGKPPAPAPPKVKPKATAKAPASGVPKPPAPVAEEKNIPPEKPSNEDEVEAYAGSQALKQLKIREELEKLRLKNRESRGELIKRETVQADVAAVLGIDEDALVRKVCDVVDREVLAVLKQVKREQNKFLKKIGAEKITKEERKNVA
jgi:hypothetical protein